MNRWVTIEEACEALDVSPRTIHRWRKKYCIRAGKAYPGAPLRICLQDLTIASGQAFRANPAMQRL